MSEPTGTARAAILEQEIERLRNALSRAETTGGNWMRVAAQYKTERDTAQAENARLRRVAKAASDTLTATSTIDSALAWRELEAALKAAGY